MFQLLDARSQMLVETCQCGKKLGKFYEGNQNSFRVNLLCIEYYNLVTMFQLLDPGPQKIVETCQRDKKLSKSF